MSHLNRWTAPFLFYGPIRTIKPKQALMKESTGLAAIRERAGVPANEAQNTAAPLLPPVDVRDVKSPR